MFRRLFLTIADFLDERIFTIDDLRSEVEKLREWCVELDTRISEHDEEIGVLKCRIVEMDDQYSERIQYLHTLLDRLEERTNWLPSLFDKKTTC